MNRVMGDDQSSIAIWEPLLSLLWRRSAPPGLQAGVFPRNLACHMRHWFFFCNTGPWAHFCQGLGSLRLLSKPRELQVCRPSEKNMFVGVLTWLWIVSEYIIDRLYQKLFWCWLPMKTQQIIYWSRLSFNVGNFFYWPMLVTVPPGLHWSCAGALQSKAKLYSLNIGHQPPYSDVQMLIQLGRNIMNSGVWRL